MNEPQAFSAEGGCPCRAVRYRMTRAPLFVHCCHCSWCQRETGSACALNAMIEASAVEVSGTPVEMIDTPSLSGKGQKVARCPRCRVALWSHYAGSGEKISFVRVGTLDQPARLPPDVHIFTSTKLPWITLPAGVPAVPEFYKPSELWPAESLARWKAARAA